MSQNNRASTLTEMVFSLLPLMVVLLVACWHGDLTGMLHSPEWAFGATILFGQAMTRVAGARTRAGSAALAHALLLTFGVVPSLLLLGKGLDLEFSRAHETVEPHPTNRLLALQVLVYALGLATFYILSAALHRPAPQLQEGAQPHGGDEGP